MKNNLFFIIISFSLFISCKKEETCTDGILNQDETAVDCGGVCSLCPIEYPHDGNYGENILNSSTVVFYLAPDYSLHAKLPEGTSLKVVLQNESGNPPTGGWFYATSSAMSLSVSSYDETQNNQTFLAFAGAQEIDLKMSFSGNGNATVKVYENDSASPTWTKAISW